MSACRHRVSQHTGAWLYSVIVAMLRTERDEARSTPVFAPLLSTFPPICQRPSWLPLRWNPPSSFANSCLCPSSSHQNWIQGWTEGVRSQTFSLSPLAESHCPQTETACEANPTADPNHNRKKKETGRSHCLWNAALKVYVPNTSTEKHRDNTRPFSAPCRDSWIPPFHRGHHHYSR